MKILQNFLFSIYFLLPAFGCTMNTDNNTHNPAPPLAGARGPDETVVNHETKECIRFHQGGACSSCDYTIQKGWVSVKGNLCPKNYENLTDQFEEKRRQIQSVFKEAFRRESIESAEKPNLQSKKKIVIHHKTNRCLSYEFNYYPGNIPKKGWVYEEYIPKEGWSYTESCPSSYTYYDDGKVFENYREIESQAVKCDKPREVPKCCKEPPYCV